MWIPFSSHSRAAVVSKKRERSPSPALGEPSAKRRVGSLISTHSPRPSDAVIAATIAFPPKTINSLPPEILHQIFDLVFPPEHLLRARPHSRNFERTRAWRKSMLAKRELVSVCRTWYLSGISFLYRNVTFLTMRQIGSFYLTLTSAPRLGAFVRTISFMSDNELALFEEDTAYRDLKAIFELCPRLTRVNDLPPASDVDAIPFPAVPPTVTALNIGSQRMPFEVYNQLSRIMTCPPHPLAPGRESIEIRALEELSLVAEDARFDVRGFDDVSIAFPHLHTLHLICTNPCATFATKWHMPKLRRLTFRVPDGTLTESPAALHRSFGRFLAQHGRALEYLAFPPWYPDLEDGRFDNTVHDYAPLLAHCPAVRHLVLPGDHDISAAHTSPSVHWVDVWTMRVPGLARCGADGFVAARFPNLKGLRRLDMALLWKLIEPPCAIDPSVRGDWMITYPGIVLAQREREGVCHVTYLPVNEAEMLLAKTAAEVASEDEEEDVLVVDDEEAQDALVADDEEEDALSNSEESSVESGDERDEASEELESDDGQPPDLRRLLQATMPQRVFATLERVLDLFTAA
ncbi:hypothetical protein C8R44DRAFT_942245 [Mycena epipterygia]|nr:hypothetical protein C8R44DRAFT_942245 [Mycena epipterygia]